MKYLKRFNEELSPAEKTAISNFPHKAKEDSEKREKRIKKSQKEDPRLTPAMAIKIGFNEWIK